MHENQPSTMSYPRFPRTNTSLAVIALAFFAIALATPACSGQKDTAQTPTTDTSGRAIDAMAYGEREAATPAERAERQTAFLTERLALSAEQIPQVEAITLDYAQRMAELREAPGDRRSKMRSARDLQNGQKAELKTVLDDQQDAELDAVYAELRDAMRERMRERRGR